MPSLSQVSSKSQQNNMLQSIIQKLPYVALAFVFVMFYGGPELASIEERHRSLAEQNAQEIIQQKTQASPIQTSQEHSPQKRDKLNILTLGGSVTWGAAIPNRGQSYPNVLRDFDKHNVTNLAIRATGSDYPAQCISSMFRIEEYNEESTYHPEVPFDVIIFEFSINGMSGFDLLLKRLQERFPDALFIYIDLWSLRNGGAMDSTSARQLVKEAGGYVYFFGNKGTPLLPFEFRDLPKYEIGSKTNSPPDHIMQLFADDTHHISTYGHSLARFQVKTIIEQYGKIPMKPRLGSWHGGDKCRSWFEDGKVSDSLQIIDGAKLNEWDKEKHKFAIELDAPRAVIEYTHNGDNEAPINFQFMTKSIDKWDVFSGLYPPVVVRITPAVEKIENTQEIVSGFHAESNGEFHPNLKLISDTYRGPDDGWNFISSVNKLMGLRHFHITSVEHGGTLKPGKNYIQVYTLEKRKNPFRLTATIVCEACAQLGWKDFS